MQSRFVKADAEAMVARYGEAGVSRDLALRVYTTRLLGADPRLVLHGGGNTSVKTRTGDLMGREVEVLCVKGSGADMAAIEPAGLPAVRLAELRELRAREALSDEDMVRLQRANLIDPMAPNPSVETLLHAFLPHKFVDHTHSTAVLSLIDQPDGEVRAAEVYDSRMGIVPYIMPGFSLAKKAAEIYEQWKQTYPRDTLPWDNLALLYWNMGQHEKSLANASEALRLDPKDRYAYQNLSATYESLNRFDEAQAVVDQAVAAKMDSRSTRFARYALAFNRGDTAAMQRVIDETAGTLDEPILAVFKARGENSLGKIHSARQDFNRAVQLAQQHGLKEYAAIIRAIEAGYDAELGYPAEARLAIADALNISQDRDPRIVAAHSLALVGDTARAQKLVDGLSRELPSDTFLNKVSLPVVRAILELQGNQPAKAIALLEVTVPYELGAGPRGAIYWPIYIRGAAYLKARDGAKSLAEYRKILDHPGIDRTSTLLALARLGSARAYAIQGDTAQARTAYQDFLAKDLPVIWIPVADANLSLVKKTLHGWDPQDPILQLYPENWYFTAS